MLTSLSVVVLTAYLADKESIYIDKLETRQRNTMEKIDKK